MFKTGKYAKKTFEEVCNSNEYYVEGTYSYAWKPNKEFYEYCLKRFEEIENTDDFMPTQTNVSKHIRENWKRESWRDLYHNLRKIHLKFEFGSLISCPNSIEKDIFGSFIDYYIRYKICKITQTPFEDIRCSRAGFCFNKNYDEKIQNNIVKTHCICEENISEFDATPYDIFIISLSHHRAFGRYEVVYKYYDINPDVINNISFEKLDNYIASMIKNKKIYTNPSLGNTFYCENGSIVASIAADADLIIEDEIIDIKCTQNRVPLITEYLQLAVYYFLAKQIEEYKNIKKITIFNPIIGYTYTIEITNEIYKDIANCLGLLAYKTFPLCYNRKCYNYCKENINLHELLCQRIHEYKVSTYGVDDENYKQLIYKSGNNH